VSEIHPVACPKPFIPNLNEDITAEKLSALNGLHA
jgi:hypothetical protein